MVQELKAQLLEKESAISAAEERMKAQLEQEANKDEEAND